MFWILQISLVFYGVVAGKVGADGVGVKVTSNAEVLVGVAGARVGVRVGPFPNTVNVPPTLKVVPTKIWTV